MVNLAVVEEMAEEEMRKKRQLRQMLARQNASRSQIMPNIKEVITETDDDKPNKKVTTIDYSTILDEPPPEKGGLLSRLGDIFSGGDLSGQGSFIEPGALDGVGPGDLNPEAPPFDIIDNQYVRRPDVERDVGPSSMAGPLRDIGTWLSEVDWMGATPFSSGKSQPEGS